MKPPTFKQLLEGALKMRGADAHYYARLDPPTMKLVVEALTLTELNYRRTNHSQPDMMLDDEHEAWGAIREALAALNRP